MKIKEYTNNITPELMALLYDADPNVESINEYIESATLLIAYENNSIVGVIALKIMQADVEIKNIAVNKDYRRKGIGGKLISEAKKYCKQKQQIERMVVGTGNSSVGQLCFYQNNGFRVVDVIPDYFDRYPQRIYENGIRCRDLLILRYEFTSSQLTDDIVNLS